MFPTGFIEVCSLGSEKLFLGVLTKNKFFFANYSQWRTNKEFKKKSNRPQVCKNFKKSEKLKSYED
jgi:hypothetical protein